MRRVRACTTRDRLRSKACRWSRASGTIGNAVRSGRIFCPGASRWLPPEMSAESHLSERTCLCPHHWVDPGRLGPLITTREPGDLPSSLYVSPPGGVLRKRESRHDDHSVARACRNKAEPSLTFSSAISEPRYHRANGAASEGPKQRVVHSYRCWNWHA